MRHRRLGTAALLTLTLLAGAVPVAADGTAATVPLNQNLVVNGTYDRTPRSGDPIPGWHVTGDVHTERFGTRAFPYPAYGRKYGGGARYLSCFGGRGGSVWQDIRLEGRADRSYKLRVRITSSVGGVKGHRVQVSLRAIDDDAATVDGVAYTPPSYASRMRVLEITNHYKRATTALTIPNGTDRIRATVRLLPKAGATACKVMTDTTRVFLYRP